MFPRQFSEPRKADFGATIVSFRQDMFISNTCSPLGLPFFAIGKFWIWNGNVAAPPRGLPARPVIDAYPAAVGDLPPLRVVQVFPDRRRVSPHHRADQDEHRDRGDEEPRRLRTQ